MIRHFCDNCDQLLTIRGNWAAWSNSIEFRVRFEVRKASTGTEAALCNDCIAAIIQSAAEGLETVKTCPVTSTRFPAAKPPKNP
jgi:hypothetical protein